MTDWIMQHLDVGWKEVLIFVGLFVATFVGSLAVVTWVLVKLPAGYFSDAHSHPPMWGATHPVLRWTALILKNLLGAALVVLGIIMLFGPGQGVITILIGVMLLNFPGKRRLEKSLVRRPRVLAAINALRARFQRPPLIVDHDAFSSASPSSTMEP